MPFKSEAQRRFMYATHPKIAKRWEKHTPKDKKLPENVSSESYENQLELLLNQPIDISIANNGYSNAISKFRNILKDVIQSETFEINNSKIPAGKLIKLSNVRGSLELESIRPNIGHLVEDPGYSVGWGYGGSDDLKKYLNNRLKKLDGNTILNTESYDKYIIKALVESLQALEEQGIITGLEEWTIKPSITGSNIVIKPR